jgi:hypothetical protein
MKAGWNFLMNEQMMEKCLCLKMQFGMLEEEELDKILTVVLQNSYYYDFEVCSTASFTFV